MEMRGIVVLLLGFLGPSQAAVAAVSVSEILAVIEAIEEHHIEPPTRQEMVLAAAREILRTSSVSGIGDITPKVNAQLSSTISQLVSKDEISVFLNSALADARPELGQQHVARAIVRASRIHGRQVSARISREQDDRVAEQIKDNRYVGIGIRFAQFSQPDVGHGFSVLQVMPRGPAYQAGVQANDLILSADGVSMIGVKQQKFLSSLRGKEGTNVAIEVQQSNADEVRSYTITRAVVPRVVIEGWSEKSPTEWEYLMVHDIGYVRPLEIGSSTVHELKRIEHGLRDFKEVIGFDLVIDLRQVGAATLTHTVMLADALRRWGRLGRMETRRGEVIYESDEDRLFPNSLIYLLVDGSVSGYAEWLASVLQRDNQIQVMGTQTAGYPYADTEVPVSDGKSVTMPTTVLKSHDGPLRVTLDLKPGSDSVPAGVALAFQQKKNRRPHGLH